MTHIQDYINEAVAKRKTGKYGDGAIGVGMKLDDCCSTLNSYGLPICGKHEGLAETAMTKNKPCYDISVEILGKRYVNICFPDGDLFSIIFAHGISSIAYLIGGPTKGRDYSTGDTEKAIEILNKRLEEL